MTRPLLAIVAMVVSLAALAQPYPNKPIRLVVGYPPGGSGDFLTRLAADELTKELGVPVIVDNRPGAGGNIAHDLVAHSAPDGTTVLNATHMAINRALYKSLTYDPDKDFAAVTRIATGPTVICVNNNLPVKDLRQLIAYAKQNPGKLFHASAGYGSAPHLASVLFESVAGIKFTHVQFKGGGPATQSLLAGDTQVNFATAGYDFTFWFGLFVPAGTPHPAIERLHAAMVKGLAKPDVRDKIALQGMDATPSATPAAFEAEVKKETPYWEKLVHDSGAKVE